jgi:hypothetical protein
LLAFNPQLTLPRVFQWNLALEQSLGTNQSLSATYIGAAGNKLLQTISVFHPASNPGLSGILVDNSASSNYQALQIQFRRRLASNFQALASYTWSHSIDDGSAGSYGNASNLATPGSTNQNRGASDFDIRNSFTAALTYAVPHLGGGFLKKTLLGGWSTDNFLLVRSAAPVDLTDINFFEFDSGIVTNIRPDTVPGQDFYLHGARFPGGKAFNPVAFADPPVDPNTENPIRQGNLGRNVLRGFGAAEWDFGVHRDFPIRESLTLQLRAELFNVLNYPNFGPPSNEFGGAGFGISTQMLGQSLGAANLGGGGLSPLYQIGGPRSIQFALKVNY